ncbi:MAG: SRPBCC family protein [Williamsia herbipolensis]|nr:SRPBCC family protein [Williamsia herbipolensis]
MARVTRRFDCPPDAVFDVLADGWLFVAWVVGTARCRDVEQHWPSVGARIHHSFGVWPALIDDTTTSLEWAPGRRAVFEARGWPLGEARVEIDVRASGTGSVVRITEYPVRGPGRLLRPLLEPFLFVRNVETLRRLREIVEGRHRSV